MTSVSRGRAELRQSAANLLQLPILIAVAVIAMVIRQLFVHPPSIIVLGVCAELAALDIVLAVYLLRNMGSALVVTADDITFTRRPRRGQAPARPGGGAVRPGGNLRSVQRQVRQNLTEDLPEPGLTRHRRPPSGEPGRQDKPQPRSPQPYGCSGGPEQSAILARKRKSPRNARAIGSARSGRVGRAHCCARPP